MAARGCLNQCTDLEGLDALMSAGPATAYVGFDATADSLHVGHLLSLMTLRRLQRAGHRPIVLIGGGTTKVGDPSFRDTTRPMLDEEAIARNAEGLRRIASRFVRFGDGPSDALLLDNADWLDPLRFIGFLRDVGRHFTVGRMLSFDSVRNRIDREEGISLLEFTYMTLQAFDFLHLSRERGCVLQMGGSDQWGNIVNGVELARKADRRQVFGLTTPLLQTASGEKMGKTAGGAVWLDPDRLSSFDLWQWWRNAADADVGRFLLMFTDLPVEECRRLAALEGPGLNEAKAALADAAVGIAHGPEAAAGARDAAASAFDRGGDAAALPVVALSGEEASAGMSVVDLMLRAGFATGRGEARRAIAGGGVRVDGEKVADEAAALTAEALMRGARLSSGRKRHVQVRVS